MKIPETYRLRFKRPALVLGSALVVMGVVGFPVNGALRSHAAPVPAPASAPKGTLTYVTDGSPADLDPASQELATSDVIVRNIDETLVKFEGLRIDRVVPSLATSWRVSNGGKTYTFSLRHHVLFHTGREMTSEDVRYCLVRTVAAGLTNSYLLSRFMSHPSRQIQALNRYSVRFTLDRPSPFFLSSLANEYVTLILDSHALRTHQKGKDFAHGYATFHDLGTGPYTISQWQHSQQVVLKAFPRYWRGWSGTHFARIVMSTVPETSTRRQLVEKGQADMTRDLTPQDNKALQSDLRVHVRTGYGTEVDYITMNQYGPLASPLARRAISYAFNYDAALAVAFKGFGKRALGPVPSVLLGYDPNGFRYNTNLAKAKALLQQAGVKPGTTLTYTYYPAPWTEGSGRILQAQLQQIGINVKLQRLDEAAWNSLFYSNTPPKKRPNLMPFGWWPDYNDPYDMSNVLLNSQASGANGANGGFYHSRAADRLLSMMKNAPRPALVRYARQFQDVVTRQDPPSIWVAEPADVTVMVKGLKGYSFNPLSMETYDFYAFHR